jgi:hypothetical protein
MTTMNLDQDTARAITALKGNQDFLKLLAAQGRLSHNMLMKAVDTPLDQRLTNIAYAKAMRDWYTSVYALLTAARAGGVTLPDYGTDLPGAKPVVMADGGSGQTGPEAAAPETPTPAVTTTAAPAKAAPAAAPAKATK